MVQKSLPFVCTFFLCFLAPSSAWTQGETCLPLQDSSHLKVELIRVTNLQGFSDCAGNSGCGKVYYKAFLRYSGPQSAAFNLPYAELSVNVSFTSINGSSYIDEVSSRQCFKNTGNWPEEVFQVSPTTAGLHLMVKQGADPSTTCTDTKKRMHFQPGTPPAGSAVCPNPIGECMYLELFTLVVNAVPGDVITLELAHSTYHNGLMRFKLKVENSFNAANGANAITPYTVPPLSSPPAPYTQLRMEVTAITSGSQLNYLVFIRNTSTVNLSLDRLEFTIEVTASTALKAPALRLSFGSAGSVTPSYIYQVSNIPNKYQLRYVVRNVTIPASEVVSLGDIFVAPPQPNNQKWWATVAVLPGKTLMESAAGCTSVAVSATAGSVTMYSGTDEPCDANINPVTFFVRSASGACSGTQDIEVGLSAAPGNTPIIEELEFEIDFNVQNGTVLDENLDLSNWFNCSDCTAPVLTGNTLQCHFTTSAVNFQGERKIGINYGVATGCIHPNVRILRIKYRGFTTACYPVSDVQRVCPPNIGGRVETETGEGIRDVFVTVSPVSNACADRQTYTLESGYYGTCFQDCPGAPSYKVTPVKDDNPLNGVTTLDLALISKHILNLKPLNSPYKLIAADANKSGTITTLDIVALRRLILGIDEELPNNTSWRCIDKEYVFPNPANPFTHPFPETQNVGFNGIANFIGVKVGDVNGTAIPARGVPLPVSWSAGPASANNTLIVPVYYTGESAVASLQMGLRFDPAQLRLTGTLPGALPEWNKDCFGLGRAEQGEIRTLWLSMDPWAENPVKPGTLLFSLVFKVGKAFAEKDFSLRLDNQILYSAAWASSSTEHPLHQGKALNDRAIHALEQTPASIRVSCYPNPAIDKVQFSIESTRDEPGRIALFNALGQRVWVQDVPLTTGQQTLTVDAAAQLPRGVYIWKVYGGENKIQGNLILE